ncbi:MAG: AAA family ATPase [Terriglobales bacterium]
MRKWNRDRRRRRKPGGSPEAGQEQTVPTDTPEMVNPPEVSPADVGPVEELQPEDAGAAASMPQKSRSRGRRRKKKPATAAPQPAAPAAPIIPAYSETEGPRAPASPVLVKPGGPTGEAAELEPLPPAPVVGPARPAPVPAPVKRASKGAVVLSVGLPGSGKTTWFKRKGVTPLSSDVLRSLLFDDPTEQRHQDLVFSSLRYLLRARMMARMPANYVDATNLSPKERRHWIRMAREFGYEVHAVYFDVPLETCMERNRRRQRIVPQDVMQRMSAKLRPPTFEEGFSKIIVVRVKHRPEHENAAGLSQAAGPGAPEAQSKSGVDVGE